MNPFTTTFRLPIQDLGLTHLPAIPVNLKSLIETLALLEVRKYEASLAADGLITEYTIGGTTAQGYDFLYGGSASAEASSPFGLALSRIKTEILDLQKNSQASTPDGVGSTVLQMIGQRPSANAVQPTPLTLLPLSDPSQFTIGWTTTENIYSQSRPLVPGYAGALTSNQEASAQFWPMIAEHGQAYNLLILQKLTSANVDGIRSALGAHWTSDHETSFGAGELFFIDLRLFGQTPSVDSQSDLFTPSTLTILRRTADTKQILPVLVLIEGANGQAAVTYDPLTSAGGTWIYALEAVRTSVTIWGILIGHVYHWHIATAALAMTFAQTIPPTHCLQALLAPHFDHLIGFDNALLLLWSDIVPPMSVASGLDFLQLADRFAAGRTFYDDDPLQTIANCGLVEAEFTNVEPWDLYPVAQGLVKIWEATVAYVGVFVDNSYTDDATVTADAPLQQWIAASSSPSNGNVAGLGTITTRQGLKNFLQSLLFRVVMHGVSRVNETANPALSFASNYPTCLNGSKLPPSSVPFSTQDLLELLPRTGQIGQIFNFYSIFVFSLPYESFIPELGVDTRLQFPGGGSDPRNAALIQYRSSVAAYIQAYQKLQISLPIQEFQWPLCIET